MNKHSLYHESRRKHLVKPWYLFLLAVLLVGVGLLAMRTNYSHMVVLRDKVYAADKAGTGVEQSLQDLRDYVGHHMNTSLSSGANAVYPPIQLKYTYDRLIAAKSKETSDYNAHIYTNAQKYCEAKIPTGFSGKYRVACIQEYVTKHKASPNYISADLYKFDFYSPAWAPDLAGLSFAFAIFSFAAGSVLLVARRFPAAPTK